MEIKASESTYLKKKWTQSTDPDNQIDKVDKGDVYRVEEVIKKEQGHTLVKLAWGYGTWYVFDKDWEGLEGEKRYKYREVTPERRIALDLIAWCEGTDLKLDGEASGYDIQFSGKRFKDLSSHPFEVIRASGYSSSAAGRYQIMDFKEKELLQKYSKLDSFSPEQQDERGILLIEMRGALNEVDNLDLEGFCRKCSKEWASLPYSPYGQPVKTLSEVQAAFEVLKGVHLKKETSTGIKTTKTIKYSPRVAEAIQRQYQRLEKYNITGKPIELKATKTIYAPQRDNYRDPHRTCNSSANAEYLDWIMRVTGRKGLGVQPDGDLNDDGYIRQVFAIGDTTIHGVQTQVIKNNGFSTKWMVDKDFPFIYSLLREGFPVPCNIKHRGSDRVPSGGHIILLLEVNGNNLIVDDPYGTLESNYTFPNGHRSVISKRSFELRSQGGYRILA